MGMIEKTCYSCKFYAPVCFKRCWNYEKWEGKEMTEKTEFTPEFIAAELTKASKATPRPWIANEAQEWQPGIGPFDSWGADIYNPDARDGIVVGGLQDEQGGAVGVLKNVDVEWIIAAANHYEEALMEIERLQYEVDAAQDVVDAGKVIIYQLQARAEVLESVIRGMFPLWINAMGYCEHGRHSELMAMRNYYNGRDNPMTNEDIHLMFSLIPEKGGE